MRVSYENNQVYFMSEISRRETFYYTTPLFTSSGMEGKLDNLLENYQHKEPIFKNLKR